MFVCCALTSELPVTPVRATVRGLNQGSFSVPVQGAKATVLVFVLADCPIGNRYVPELNRIRKSFGPRGVEFRLVYEDPEDGWKRARTHYKDFAVSFPAGLDVGQKLLKSVGATISPECALLGPDGRVRYRGRIDDVYTGHGTRKPKPDRQDLRIALEEFLGKREISLPCTSAIGCFLNQT